MLSSSMAESRSAWRSGLGRRSISRRVAAIGGDGAGDAGFGEGFVELVGTDAATAVDGEVPGDADEPDAEVADGGKILLVFKDAEEGVLDDVFGFGTVAENGMGNAEEQAGVGLDERRDVRLRGSFCGDKRHVPIPFPVAGQLQPTARSHD
jgi:hypothetical protein